MLDVDQETVETMAVFREVASGRSIIRDFDPMVDDLDLSAWGIQQLSELTVREVNGRIIIEDTQSGDRLVLRSKDGPLELMDLDETIFKFAPFAALKLEGTDAADKLIGWAGDDLFDGGAVDDQLRDDAGNQVLEGSFGADSFIFAASAKVAAVESLIADVSTSVVANAPSPASGYDEALASDSLNLAEPAIANEGPSVYVGNGEIPFNDVFVDGDASSLISVTYIGADVRSVWDARPGAVLDFDVHVFEATYSTGHTIEFLSTFAVGNAATANPTITDIADMIGLMPLSFLPSLDTVIVHDVQGWAAAFWQDTMIAGANYDRSYGWREEIVLHEFGHLHVDPFFDEDPALEQAWLDAQIADGITLTNYSLTNTREDRAETTIAYVSARLFPDRLAAGEAENLEAAFSNRFAVLDSLGLDLTTSQSLLENGGSVASATNDNLTFSEAEAGRFLAQGNLLSNDTGYGDLTLTQVDGKNIGGAAWVDLSGGGRVFVNAEGRFAFNASGEFNDLNYGQSRQTSFNYTVRDALGNTDVATATFKVTGITPADAKNDQFTFSKTETNKGYDVGNLLSNDTGSGGLTVTQLNGKNIGAGAWVDIANGGWAFVNANGRFDFTASGEFNDLNNGQSRQTSFNYTMRDGLGNTDVATAIFNVTGDDWSIA